MRIEVYFARRAPERVKRRVRDAFAAQGLSIDVEGPAAVKADLISVLRFDLAFILGATVEGVIYEAEKEALRRAIAAARSVWSQSGSTSIEVERQERVIYMLPGGPESDKAFDAIDDDFVTAPPGPRTWLPGAGWIADADLLRIMDSVRPGLTQEEFNEAVTRLARGESSE